MPKVGRDSIWVAVLERGGAESVELDEAAFAPEQGSDPTQQAAAFGSWVAARGLATDLALAEWTMRASAHSLRVVAVAEATCSVSALRSGGGAVEEADRLVVLARHRPHQ